MGECSVDDDETLSQFLALPLSNGCHCRSTLADGWSLIAELWHGFAVRVEVCMFRAVCVCSIVCSSINHILLK
jgi:hypothetical protein